MTSTYIQDKLLEKHICRFNDGECNCDCYIAGMTDYHNHIVEKIDGMKQNPDSNDKWGQYELGVLQGYDKAIRDILSILQDTNPKE